MTFGFLLRRRGLSSFWSCLFIPTFSSISWWDEDDDKEGLCDSCCCLWLDSFSFPCSDERFGRQVLCCWDSSSGTTDTFSSSFSETHCSFTLPLDSLKTVCSSFWRESLSGITSLLLSSTVVCFRESMKTVVVLKNSLFSSWVSRGCLSFSFPPSWCWSSWLLSGCIFASSVSFSFVMLLYFLNSMSLLSSRLFSSFPTPSLSLRRE